MARILLIANKVPHYRVSVYNYLCRRFHDVGWDLKVASDLLLRETDQRLRFDFYQIGFRFLRYRRLVNELSPDVVILHLHLKVPMFWPLIHWLRMRRIPIVSWTKGANLDRPDSKLRHELFNYAHRLSDALLLYSINETGLIKPAYHHKVFPANNAVNFEDYPEIKESKEQIKAELNLPFRKVVLFVGTMGVDGERKRVKHLVEVFNSFDRSDIGLVLVGSGMREELRKSINLRNTRVLGAVHDPANLKISKVFKASDIYVVPGHVGLGINQAFYWGLPVVTESCHQPPEIHYLKDGRNGYIVPDGDLISLRAKILYLLDNDDLREEFSRQAKEDIHNNASIEAMFQSFVKAVEFARLSRRDSSSTDHNMESAAA